MGWICFSYSNIITTFHCHRKKKSQISSEHHSVSCWMQKCSGCIVQCRDQSTDKHAFISGIQSCSELPAGLKKSLHGNCYFTALFSSRFKSDKGNNWFIVPCKLKVPIPNIYRWRQLPTLSHRFANKHWKMKTISNSSGTANSFESF